MPAITADSCWMEMVDGTSNARREADTTNALQDLLRLARLSADAPFAQLCVGNEVLAWSSDTQQHHPTGDFATIAELHPANTPISIDGDFAPWAASMQAAPLTGPSAEAGWLIVVADTESSFGPSVTSTLDICASLAERTLDRSEEAHRLGDVGSQLRQSQADLRRSGEQLEISNRELEQFAYVASHELVAPLRAVSVYAQLLGQILAGTETDPATNQKVDSCIGEITRGVGLMSNQVQSLLELSSINSTKTSPEPVEADEVVGNALATLAPQLDEADAHVTTDQLSMIYGQVVPLQSVFANLISNALRYRHPDRKLAIHISSEDVGSHHRITVRDNGIGVTEADADRIFGLFERASTTTDGTGIGLALSRRIVESFGGRIGIEMDTDVGSVFWVELRKAADGIPEDTDEANKE